MPRATINGFELYYQTFGDPAAEPVVCTTGWGTITGHRVSALPDGLIDRYYVIAYDHRGIGQSAGGLDRPPSTRLYAEDVVGLLDHLGIARAHVFGRGGMGGCIAQEIGINAPDRVHSLILGQSWARADDFLRVQIENLRELRKLDFYRFQSMAAMLCHRVEHFNRHLSELLGPNGGWADLIEHEQAHLNFMQACLEHDTRDRLGRISAPTLVIHGGELDLMTGERLGREVHSLIPGSELLVLEDAPHSIKTEPSAWQRYCAAVTAFLAKHAFIPAAAIGERPARPPAAST